jgi:hypothetical protein
VHQDALTFALGFFNYKLPSNSVVPPPPAADAAPLREGPAEGAAHPQLFFQQVAIAAVDARIDYNPTVCASVPVSVYA